MAHKINFADLEKNRLQLEEKVNGLRKALAHWQKWDAEYEGLREEVEALPSPASRKDLARIRRDYEGDLVDKKEVGEIFGRVDLKPQEQIVNLLTRRIDYVTRNIETLQKQLDEADRQYADAAAADEPHLVDEETLPITEIVEELDDDDNVVSYQLHTPSDAGPQVRQMLKKAGLDDLPDFGRIPDPEQSSKVEQDLQPSASKQQPDEATIGSQEISTPSAPPKKAVTFTEDTKSSDGGGPYLSRTAKRLDRILRTAREQEESMAEAPIIPEAESEEDETLRQEMLKYGLREVGAVVAELSLEDGSDDDEDDDCSDDGDDGDDEGEDEHGRSLRSAITPAYRQRMLDLERRLGITSHPTQDFPEEPEVDSSDEETTIQDEGIGRIVVDTSETSDTSAPSNSPRPVAKTGQKPTYPGSGEAKKTVRFASSLEVASNNPSQARVKSPPPPLPKAEPVGDVVERTGASSTLSSKHEADPSRKMSRFKKYREQDLSPDDPAPPSSNSVTIPRGPHEVPTGFLSQDKPTAPSGPEGTTLAASIVEHDTSSTPQDPMEFDDLMLQQEVAEDFQRMRRKFIHRNGGFLKEDEGSIQPLDDDGGSRRVSRFKAARLSRQ